MIQMKMIENKEIIKKLENEGFEVSFMHWSMEKEKLQKILEDFKASKPKPKKKTQKQIKQEIQDVLESHDKAVAEAILFIYSNQTHEEQIQGETLVDNGIGFSGAHAEFLSSLAVQYEKYNKLSSKQIASARKIIKKYWKQLSEDERFFNDDWEAMEEFVHYKKEVKKVTCYHCQKENLVWKNSQLFDTSIEDYHHCEVKEEKIKAKEKADQEKLAKMKSKNVKCNRCGNDGYYWFSSTFKKGSWVLRSIKTDNPHRCGYYY